MPGITSGMILAAGRMLGESAALIMIWGSFSWSSVGSWMESGGTTLATEIYRLTGDYKVIPWEAIKAIGIVIMSIILLLTMAANAIEQRKKRETLIIVSSILLMLLGVVFASIATFIIGISLAILSVIMTMINSLLIFTGQKGINILPSNLEYELRTRFKK